MNLPSNVVKVLTFPVAFPAVFLINLPNATCESLQEKLGTAHKTGWIDGLGNADFWAFEFTCGMQVAIECLRSPPTKVGARIAADIPEVEHLQRHLDFLNEKCLLISEEELAGQLKLLSQCYPERSEGIANLRTRQVWRIDDNGNVFKVGEPTSERAARCCVNQFELRHHKQTYWSAKV